MQDLTELFDAPSLDVAGKKVKDTLVPGTVEQGTFNGKPYVLNYAFTVFGLWYDSAAVQEERLDRAEDLGRVHRAAATRSRRPASPPYAYAGANARVLPVPGDPHQRREDRRRRTCSRTSTTSRTAPGPATPVKQAAAAWAEIGAKYGNKAHLGLKHTEVQLQQNQGKVGVLPVRLLAGERAGQGHPGRLQVRGHAAARASPPSDKLPQTAIYAAAGEMYFVAAKGKNPRGGMEYLRHMLSKEGAKGFTELTKVLTVVQGAADGLDISPGLTSGNEMLKAAGADDFALPLRHLVQEAGRRVPGRHQRADVQRRHRRQVLRPDAEDGRRGQEGLVRSPKFKR